MCTAAAAAAIKKGGLDNIYSSGASLGQWQYVYAQRLSIHREYMIKWETSSELAGFILHPTRYLPQVNKKIKKKREWEREAMPTSRRPRDDDEKYSA